MKRLAIPIVILLFALLCSSCRSGDYNTEAEIETNSSEQSHVIGTDVINYDSGSDADDGNEEESETEVRAIKIKEVEQSAPRGAETVRRVEYNRQGRITRDTQYRFSDGEIAEDTINEYDDSGIEIVSTIVNDGVVAKKYEYVRDYDVNGRVNATVVYLDGVKRNEVHYEYDGVGNVLLELSVDLETGNQYLSRENVYDSRNNQILSTTYDRDGSIISTLEREYNDDDNLIKERAYGGNEKGLTHEYRFSYDANGNILEKYELDLRDNSLRMTEQYVYNVNNILVALIRHSGNSDRITGINVYDVGGRPYYNDDISIDLTSVASDADITINYSLNGFVSDVDFKQVDGVLVRYVYEYDDEGYMTSVGYPTGYYNGDAEAGLAWKWYHREFWE